MIEKSRCRLIYFLQSFFKEMMNLLMQRWSWNELPVIFYYVILNGAFVDHYENQVFFK